MSGSVALNIKTNSDWSLQLDWFDDSGQPIVFTNPIMEMRQELAPTGTRIASFDQTGQLDGIINLISPGSIQILMSANKTNNLVTGHGFWDLFVDAYGQRVRLAFGTVDIDPHVTGISYA